MVKRILYNDGENMLAVTDDELIIIDDYAIKGLIREALLLPVESLYMMRHRLLMQPVLPRMNTMIMRKETMRLYSIELLSLIRI